MSVYVDPLMTCLKSAKWRWSESCHLFADTVQELHDFAVGIGLARNWFQEPTARHGCVSFLHYDLTPSKRIEAVKAGAIELDRNATVSKWRELRFAPVRCPMTKPPTAPTLAMTFSNVELHEICRALEFFKSKNRKCDLGLILLHNRIANHLFAPISPPTSNTQEAP